MSRYQYYRNNGYDEESALRALLSDIKRQFITTVTTVSVCKTDGCENFSRGGTCAKCLTKEVGETINNHGLAACYYNGLRAAADAEAALLQCHLDLVSKPE